MQIRTCFPDLSVYYNPGHELPNAQHTQSSYFSHMPKSSVIIFHSVLFHIQCVIIRKANRQSPTTTCLTQSTLTSVLLVEGLPILESYFACLWFSFNLFCHSKTRVRDMSLSTEICWDISSACGGGFPHWTKNFQVYLLLSVHSWTTWKKGGKTKAKEKYKSFRNFCLDYVLRTSIHNMKDNGFKLEKVKKQKIPRTYNFGRGLPRWHSTSVKYTRPSRISAT